MAASYQFHGHAIVSDDDMIADAAGHMPAALRNASDWARFQHALDKAAAVVLGRKGHLAHPNTHNRNRIVLSTAASGIEKRTDAWWWNPADTPLAETLASAVPGGGIVAIPGGQAVFDYFLKAGYDEFHLTRAHGVTVPGGVTVFSECASNRSAEEILATHGLIPASPELLDAAARVSLTVWHKTARV